MFDKLITFVLFIVGFFSSKLNKKSRMKFGRFIGFILRKLSKKRENIARDNLKRAFPNKNNEEIEYIIRKSYENLGIVLVEVPAMRYIKDSNFAELVHYENIELITEVYSRNKGLILLSGHYGNWEYLAYTAGLFSKIPILIIVKPQKNRYVDNILNQLRIRSGNSVVSMFSAARDIMKTIKDKKALALLVDQSASPDKDIFVDFFGNPAATYEAPAGLALKFDIPIIYGFAVRQEDGSYKVKLEELEYNDLKDSENAIEQLTIRHVKALEDAIRKHPDHWVWQHKRWKYDPNKFIK